MTAAAQATRMPLVLGIRLTRMFWRMLGTLAVSLNLVAWAWLLDASAGLKEQALVAATYVAAYGFLVALAQEILSPRNAELRLLPIPDHRAARLLTIARGVLFIVLGTHLAIYLVRANQWSESVAALLLVLERAGLILFGWSLLARSGLLDKLTPAKTEHLPSLVVWLVLKVVLPLAVLTLLFYVIATALGYGALSGWVVMNAGWTAGYILLLGVVQRVLRRRVHKTLKFMQAERDAGADEGQAPVPWYIGVERILGGALHLLVVAALCLGLLSIWSVEMSDVNALLAKPALIGGQTWGMLLRKLGLAVAVWIGYLFLRNALIFIVFPKADVEPGARYAMLTVLRYVAIAFTAILVLAALGADTSTLAVFAGGASVGLGFAMKDVFSNFFGGLIMLFERPVRVGDTIEVSGVKGKVEAIRLRGTTLRTFDGTIVIIPNTSMISSSLANLTNTFETARMQIDVGVSYDENPGDVERILLEVARADPRVTDDPEPVVRFNAFGASSLDFSLRVWTKRLDERWAMVSEMRRLVFERFKQAGIEIPFNQVDLHVRSTPPVSVQQPPVLGSAPPSDDAPDLGPGETKQGAR